MSKHTLTRGNCQVLIERSTSAITKIHSRDALNSLNESLHDAFHRWGLVVSKQICCAPLFSTQPNPIQSKCSKIRFFVFTDSPFLPFFSGFSPPSPSPSLEIYYHDNHKCLTSFRKRCSKSSITDWTTCSKRGLRRCDVGESWRKLERKEK